MNIAHILPMIIPALLAVITIFSAIKVASTRSIIHAAYWLLPVFAGIAGFYLYLDAQFLAAIQVLIYIGAILVLIIFAVTLTRNANDREMRQSNKLVVPVLFAAVVMLASLMAAVLNTTWPVTVNDISSYHLLPGLPVTDIAALGVVLLQQYLLPFEIISVLLLAAMIAAIVMARKERDVVADERTEL